MSNRDPSLHCKLSNLESFLALKLESGEILSDKTVKDLAWEMLETLNEQAPNHRSIVSKAKKEVVSKAIKLDKAIIESFNILLYNKRVSLKHKGAVLINDQSKDYPRLISCVEKVVEFSDVFYEGDYSIGFNNYLHHAGDILGPRLTIRTLLNNHARIMEKGEEVDSIKNSEYKELAQELYSYFTSKVRKNSGLETLDYSKSEEYINFIKGAELCKKHKASAKDWVDALFANVAWTGQLPHLKDLHSSKAPQYYANYRKTLKK